ncbi:MAG: ATP-binding cassette domain-containing protein [Gemmatimonadota bacterium]
MTLVRLQDVGKNFGEVRAVDGVSFSIGRGEVVGFLGPNGAGKTTTMRLITQGLEADEGSIEIDGRSISEEPVEARRRIGYLPEANPLYGEMLVREFLEYVGRLRGLAGADLGARIGRAVEQTGIGDMYNRPIGHLSKGYRQRTGLAQAILAEPDLLILDEPTEGLDPNQRAEIRNLITHLGSDRTVLLSTHVMQEVRATCDRLLIIHHGRIIADGAVDGLLAGRAGGGVRVRVELEADPDEARGVLRGLDSVAEVRDVGDADDPRPRFLLIGKAGEDPRPDVSGLARERDWTLWELSRESEDLEELFAELTGEGR